MRRAEYRLEQVVDELLHRTFGGQQTREVNLRHHFIATLALTLRVGIVVLHKMPATHVLVMVGVERTGSAAHRRACRAEFAQIERLVLVRLVVLLGKDAQIVN